MVEFLKTHLWIFALAAVPIFIIILRYVLRHRGQRKAEEELTQLKRRDEALSEALRNPLVKDTPRGSEGAMEIAWDEKAVNNGKKGQKSQMIELVELSGYSRRKYVFHADETIRIGSAPENRLALPRDGVERVHCEIFMNGNKPCLRSAPGAKTILKRGSQPVLVGPDGVYLSSKDHIVLGSVDIQFRLFKA
ncbi:MAG: FHA domain-containing protein [Oscillibacter sp.]|nr:FHA domain-containing protein [Oscillibacter sp.]